MGKSRATTAAKTKYNEANYARYTVRVRKDDTLYNDIEDFCAKKGTSLNALINKLLQQYFFEQEQEIE